MPPDLPSWEVGDCVRLENRAMKMKIGQFLLNDNIYEVGAIGAKIFFENRAKISSSCHALGRALLCLVATHV